MLTFRSEDIKNEGKIVVTAPLAIRSHLCWFSHRPPKMPLKFFRSLWGLDSYSSTILNGVYLSTAATSSFSPSAHYNEIFNQLRQLGYRGIEASISDALAVS